MIKQATTNATGTADLGRLIEQLGPLNNQWRDGSQAEKALALWEMGEVLLNSVSNPTDKLLWELQGRSYLTRITLRYALIVRRGWRTRGELEKPWVENSAQSIKPMKRATDHALSPTSWACESQ